MLLRDFRNSISDTSEADESSFRDDARDFCTGCGVVAAARKPAPRASSARDTSPAISSRAPRGTVEGVYPEAAA